MKILALVGSPRKGSNTDILVDTILKGAETGGHKSETIHLYDYEISPCIDCRKCKKGDCVCVLKDGMKEIYSKIDEADLIIFGTPNYWFGPTAKMKLLIDRMRPYVANGKMKSKKAIVAAPAGEGAEVCGPLVEMFRMSFAYLKMEYIGEVLAAAYERGEIKDNKKALQEAFDFGKAI